MKDLKEVIKEDFNKNGVRSLTNEDIINLIELAEERERLFGYENLSI